LATKTSPERALLVIGNVETPPEAQRVRLYQFPSCLPPGCKAIVISRRTNVDACINLKNSPRENDPLEYIFGDLLDTFTASEVAVLAMKWIVDLASLGERRAQTSLEDLTDRALLAGDPAGRGFHLPPLAARFFW
jgi:hypothetical protein